MWGIAGVDEGEVEGLGMKGNVGVVVRRVGQVMSTLGP